VRPPSYLQLLQQGPIAPAYLLVGDAGWHMERAWRQLHDRLVPPSARRFNGESLLAKDTSASDVVQRLATLSMFGPKRLVRVKQVEMWNKEQQSAMLSYLSSPNPGSCLVLEASTRKGCDALARGVEQAGGKVLEFPAPSESELPSWLQEQAALRHKQLSLQGAALLLERVGTDLSRLEGEVEKLCCYVGERKGIESTDIEEAVSHQRQFTVFELIRCVGKCQAARAITILRQLLQSGEAPLGVLALLTRHIRILWQLKDGLDRGLSVEAVSQKIKLSAWVLKKEYQPNVKLFSTTALFQAHRAIEATDVALKSTATSPDFLLETLLLNLCRQHQKGPGASAPGPSKPSWR
jgi:DNA polymerase III subunit delta